MWPISVSSNSHAICKKPPPLPATCIVMTQVQLPGDSRSPLSLSVWMAAWRLRSLSVSEDSIGKLQVYHPPLTDVCSHKSLGFKHQGWYSYWCLIVIGSISWLSICLMIRKSVDSEIGHHYFFLTFCILKLLIGNGQILTDSPLLVVNPQPIIRAMYCMFEAREGTPTCRR